MTKRVLLFLTLAIMITIAGCTVDLGGESTESPSPTETTSAKAESTGQTATEAPTSHTITKTQESNAKQTSSETSSPRPADTSTSETVQDTTSTTQSTTETETEKTETSEPSTEPVSATERARETRVTETLATDSSPKPTETSMETTAESTSTPTQTPEAVTPGCEGRSIDVTVEEVYVVNDTTIRVEGQVRKIADAERLNATWIPVFPYYSRHHGVPVTMILDDSDQHQWTTTIHRRDGGFNQADVDPDDIEIETRWDLYCNAE